MIRTLSIAMLVSSVGCGSPEKGVSIHLLADASIALPEALKIPLVELELQEKPWIASDAIDYYDRSSHILMLKAPPKWGKVNLRGTPFVVTAGGERCYLGALWTAGSSFTPESGSVIIDQWDGAFMHPNALRLSLFKIYRHGEEERPVKDPRLDPRIEKALEASGKRRRGIACTLDAVEVVPRAGGSTARYAFTVKNLDRDPLYVLDPDRMGSEGFHYFTNGVTFVPKDVDESFISPAMTGFTKKPEGSIVDSLHLLRPGESMRRTVALPAYSTIAPGRYDAKIWFRSAPVPEDDRKKLEDGRLWIGVVEAEREIDVKG